MTAQRWRRWATNGPGSHPAVGVALLVVLLISGALSGVVAVGGDRLVLRGGEPALLPLGEDVPADVAFTIGDDDVTITELEDAVAVLGGLYGIQEPEGADDADTFRRETAKAVAVTRILAAAAEERGVQVSDDKVEEQLRALVDSAYGGDDDAFVAALGEKGVSEDDVREEIRNQLRNLELFNDVTADVEQPTADDIQTYFEENRQDLVSPERRALSNIVVGSRSDAVAVLRAVRSGDDFSTVARRVSLDNQTRGKGGALGELAKSELEPAYAEAAFAAEVGEPFGPVRTQSGWNVGVVTDVTASRPLTLNQVSDTIKARIYDDERLAVWNDFIADQIAEADVIYADRYRPEDPDGPPADDLVTPPTLTEE